MHADIARNAKYPFEVSAIVRRDRHIQSDVDTAPLYLADVLRHPLKCGIPAHTAVGVLASAVKRYIDPARRILGEAVENLSADQRTV